MSEPDLTQFKAKLAERKAKQAAEEKLKEEHAADLIPETPYERTDADLEVDRVIESIDIIDAYKRWCGKMVPTVRGNQREGIQISCPIPGHADTHPSAWINLDSQLWNCGACQEGGDKFVIAAYHFGYTVPEYKEGKNFVELRQKMAEDFGLRILVHPGGSTAYTEERPDPVGEESKGSDSVDSVHEASRKAKQGDKAPSSDDEAVPHDRSVRPLDERVGGSVQSTPSTTSSTVTLHPSADVEESIEEYDKFPSLDWKPIVPTGTFLDSYMSIASNDDSPEEYHFFNALMALSLSIGKDVRLVDGPPVYGNLFTCLLGGTGTGKTKSQGYLMKILRDVLPYSPKDVKPKGTSIINDAASAEVLIDKFTHPIEDPTNPKKILYTEPVRGLIEYNELSGLVARSNRTGATLTPTLIKFADTVSPVSTTSRTSGDAKATDPYACATTTVQPSVVTTLLNKTDVQNGFLNRWIFVPGSTEKLQFAVNRLHLDITAASPLLTEIFGWAGSFGPDDAVDWTPEAEKAWGQFLHGEIIPTRQKSNNELARRIDLIMKKLFLLFAANRRSKFVELMDVEAVISMYPYLMETYDILAGIVGNSVSYEMEEGITKLLAKYPEGLTLSQIRRSFRRRKYTSEELERKLSAMAKMGRIETLSTHNSGRVGKPTIRYRHVA